MVYGYTFQLKFISNYKPTIEVFLVFIFSAVDVQFEIPIVTFDLQDSCGLFKYRLKWKIYFPESFIGSWIEERRRKLM